MGPLHVDEPEQVHRIPSSLAKKGAAFRRTSFYCLRMQFSSEPTQLLSLAGGQALSLSGVDLGLLDPLSRGPGGHPEPSSGLRDRPPGRAGQPDGFPAELGWTRWSGSRRLFSSPRTFATEFLRVHGCQASPALEVFLQEAEYFGPGVGVGELVGFPAPAQLHAPRPALPRLVPRQRDQVSRPLVVEVFVGEGAVVGL